MSCKCLYSIESSSNFLTIFWCCLQSFNFSLLMWSLFRQSCSKICISLRFVLVNVALLYVSMWFSSFTSLATHLFDFDLLPFVPEVSFFWCDAYSLFVLWIISDLWCPNILQFVHASKEFNLTITYVIESFSWNVNKTNVCNYNFLVMFLSFFIFVLVILFFNHPLISDYCSPMNHKTNFELLFLK